MQFTDKYKPDSSRKIVGQKLQVQDIKKNIESYKKKALLLYGPPGTGKTSTIHAIAKELDLELIEVNASDHRNTESLEQRILPAIRQQSLFNRQKLILIDEIDGLSGNQDRGGLSSISKFIEESHYPVILTSNDIWDNKFNSIRKSCVIIEFKAISFIDTLNHLKEVCEKEGIKFEDDALSHIARGSGGDLRSALNDLQNVSSDKKTISKKDVENISEREREESIINAMLKVFKTTNPEVALGAYENVDEDIDRIFLWLDENLPKEYNKPEDLARAYDNMSVADVFFGRIRRWQYYRYYVYIYDLLSAGIALSKKEKNPDFIKYGPTSRILKIWMANQKNAKKKAIAGKIASATHSSAKRSLAEFPYLRGIFRNSDKKTQDKMTKEFKLEDEEIEWLKK
jgi:replication factor C large subunit